MQKSVRSSNSGNGVSSVVASEVSKALVAVLEFLSKQPGCRSRFDVSLTDVDAFAGALAKAGAAYVDVVAGKIDGEDIRFLPQTSLKRPQVTKWVCGEQLPQAKSFAPLLFALDHIWAFREPAKGAPEVEYDNLIVGLRRAFEKFPAGYEKKLREIFPRREDETPVSRDRINAVRQLAGGLQLIDENQISMAGQNYEGVWIAMRLRSHDKAILRFPLWISYDRSTRDLPSVTLVQPIAERDGRGVLIPSGGYLYTPIFRGVSSSPFGWGMKVFIMHRQQEILPAKDRTSPLMLGGLYLGPSHKHQALVARHALFEEFDISIAIQQSGKDVRGNEALESLDSQRKLDLESIRAALWQKGKFEQEILPAHPNYQKYAKLLSHEAFVMDADHSMQLPLYSEPNAFMRLEHGLGLVAGRTEGRAARLTSRAESKAANSSVVSYPKRKAKKRV